MLILNRPPLKVHGKASPEQIKFPAEAVVNVKLSPNELFGMAPLSGRLSIAPVGATLNLERTDYRGANRIKVKGHYPVTDFSAQFIGRNFRLKGDIATFTFSVSSFHELDLFVAYADSLFPALFSGALQVAVEVEEIGGTLQGFPFKTIIETTSSNPILITAEQLPFKAYFDTIAPQDYLPSLPIISSLRYLQQASRLESEGRYKGTFLGERILNLAKALESLFPGSIDEMRAELRGLNIAADYVEVFASVRYIRNQIDVGHAAFTDISGEAIQEVFDFASLATSCTRALINSLLQNRAEQQRLCNLRKPSKKTADATSFLLRYKNISEPKDNDLTRVQRRERP